MEKAVIKAPVKSDYSEILNAQKLFFRTGVTLKVDWRLTQLKTLRKAIQDFEKAILEALAKDLGRDHTSGYLLEVGFVLNEIEDAIGNLKSWAKPEKVPTPLFHAKGSSAIYSEPYGQVLIMAPWNYPFQLIIGPLVGAMAAGNTAILKPSELSPYTSSVVGKMIRKYFEDSYISVVEGGVEVSKALLNEKYDLIFFTGSTIIGKIIYQAAARNLTPVVLELGGKTPCIVDKDINLEVAAKRIVWGKLVNAGQTCIAPDYLLLNEEIKDSLLAEMKKQVVKMYGDNPAESPEYCKIINKSHFERLKELMVEAHIYSGGKTDSKSLYIEPTIVSPADENHPLMKEEIFGPILPVLTYNKIEDAIEFVNQRPKPLSLYIFSNRNSVIKKVLRETSSGGVCVNDTLMHIANPHLPFGGVGDSGIGAYHGKAGFDTFSHKKSVLNKSFLFDAPVRYTPYSSASAKILKTLLKYFNK